MKAVDIIENLRAMLAMPPGRHLYGILGSYPSLDGFAEQLRKAKDANGNRFKKAVAVNRGILEQIPDEEFHRLCENEAKMPRPTGKHVEKAFEALLRGMLSKRGLLTLRDLELLWAYGVELSLLRALAADNFQVLLLLPGRRAGGLTIMFPEIDGKQYTLPKNLIAENHLWELTD